jgi:hypothetical protein
MFDNALRKVAVKIWLSIIAAVFFVVFAWSWFIPSALAATTFSDDFSAGLDATKWTNSDTAYAQVRNQRLEISPPANAPYYVYVSAKNTVNLTNARAVVEVPQTTVVAYGPETSLSLVSGGDSLIVVEGGGNFLFVQRVNGSDVLREYIPYNAAQQRFWGIRHDSATDSIIFESSSDGTNWITQKTTPRKIAITALTLNLTAGTYFAVANPGTAVFDNISVTATGSPETLPLVVSADFGVKNLILLGQFFQTNLQASGGVGPYTFTLTAGALPPGLALQTVSGPVVAGTPSQAGTYQFTIAAADSQGRKGSANFSLVVSDTASSSVYPPVGYLDTVANGVAYGWSLDRDDFAASNTVNFYIDDTAQSLVGSVKTDQVRSDVNQALGVTGSHGFVWSIPDKYKDGLPHKLYAFGVDLTDTASAAARQLGTSPKTFTLGSAGAVETVHPAGTNISSGGAIYLVLGQERRRYPSLPTFLSYGFNNLSGVIPANSADLLLPEGAAIPPSDGRLFVSTAASDKGTVYLVSQGQKAGFGSSEVFIALGYNFDRAINDDISWVPATSIINNAAEPHRYGTLVNNSGTVQLMGNNGVVGIPSLEVFNSWGYSLADVVPANSADKVLSQTAVLTARQVGQLNPQLSEAPSEVNYSNDILTWLDSGLPESTYVAGIAQHFDSASQKWVDIAGVLQPFKTKVDRSLHSVYFRKDDLTKNFYGEVFRYDDNNIFLRQETIPFFPGPDPAGTWDARPDKFRLFQNVTAGAVPKPGALGRIVAPRTYANGWSVSQTFNTFYCHNWTEFKDGTCPVYQPNFYDNAVSVEMKQNFSAVFDGETDAWQAAPEFKNFDQVLVISQRMQNDVGRERFYFGAKNGTYYGFIRWDSAVLQNGQWVVTDRTVGLKTASSLQVSFDGFAERAQQDLTSVISAPLPQAVVPATEEEFINKLYTCILGRQAEDAGLQYWLDAFNSGATLARLYHGFFDSREYLNKNSSNEVYLTQMYNCVLFRAQDTEGYSRWLTALNDGSRTRGEVLDPGFLESTEFQTAVAPKLEALRTSP